MLFSVRPGLLLLLPLVVACSAGESNKDPVAEAKFQNEKRIGDEAVTKRQIRDAEFVVDAVSRHMQLLEISQIAQRKATAPTAKAVSQNAIGSLNSLQQELRALAQQKNITLPSALGAEQAKQVGELTALNGAAFDQQYAEQVGKLWEQAADAYDDMSDEAYDGDIRALAARQLPLLKQQTGAAEELQKALNP